MFKSKEACVTADINLYGAVCAKNQQSRLDSVDMLFVRLSKLISFFTMAYLMLIAAEVNAFGYSPKIAIETNWSLESSVFECKLTQEVPYYGKAVFYHRAGDPVIFYTEPKRELMKEGRASLVIDAPEWKPAMPMVDLGMVDVRNTDKSIKLDEKLAFRMLIGLKDGMRPKFVRDPWFDDNGQKVEVSLSSINFLAVYRDYNDCVAQLLPVNFDQVARSVILFRTDKFELTNKHRKQLQDIITYIKADKSVKQFFVDGHTDKVGKRASNIELSQARAEHVSQFLVENGVPIESITMRYHGERYPIADNKTTKGRARNRRVTIRLERDDGVEYESYE